MTLFGEEVALALAGVRAGRLCWSNWNLEMLVFQEGGKPENPEKNPRSKAKTNNKLNPMKYDVRGPFLESPGNFSGP